MKKIIVILLLGLVIVKSFLYLKTTSVHASASRTWDGGGATNNWSDCANWDGPDICPVAGDTVNFDTFTKNSTVDSGFGGSIGSINITSSYSGTITLAETLTVTGSMTTSGGTFNADSQSLSVNGTFTMNNVGTVFTASSGTTTFLNIFTINNGTFNANGGTVNFGGTGTVTLSCHNATFNLVTFTHTAGTKQISSNCTLPLGSSPTVTGAISLDGGTLSGSGTLTLNSSITLTTTPASISGFSGLIVNGTFTLNAAITLNLSSYSPVNMNSSFAINSGTFTAPSNTMTVGGNFNHSSGTFNSNGGTIVLNGTNQTITGTNTFTNLTKNVTSNATLTFPSSPTTTVTGTLNLQGSGGGNLSLRSSTAGTAAKINAQGSRVLSYLDVKDSNNINATAMQCGNNCIDSGNNTNWNFFLNALTLSLDNPGDGAYISDERPAFRWQAAVDNAGSTILKYKLDVDSGSGSFTLDNINANGNDYTQDGFAVQYLNFNDSDPNNDYVQVFTKSSNTWNSSQNDGILTEGKKSFKVTVYDTAGNILSFSREFFVDRTSPKIENLMVNGTKISGSITDYLSGSPASASGPFTLNFFSSFPSLNQTVSSLPTYWSLDNSLITNNNLSISNKYSPFIYTIPVSGIYQITLTAKDLAGNTINISLFTNILEATPSSAPTPLLTSQPVSSEPTPTSSTSLPTEIPALTKNPPTSITPNINLKEVLALVTSKLDSANQVLVVLTPVVAVAVLPLASFATFLANMAGSGATLKTPIKFLLTLGLIPRKVPQGVIFEANTNNPIPFAIVTVRNSEGKAVDTLVTDSKGIYTKPNLKEGIYTLQVKHHLYSFPTKNTKPVILSTKDFYRGEKFEVKKNDNPKDWYFLIPMDANVSEKQENVTLITTQRTLAILNRLGNIIFWPFLFLSALIFVTNHTLLNALILGVYILIYVYKTRDI